MTVNLVAIIGPTACGKTALGVRLAREIGGEILSADSRQVYQGLDLGTGKDRDEYRSEAGVVPCHLIDIAAPDEEFHVFAYQRLFFRRFDEIRGRGAFPILVGGSGLYLEAVLLNYPFEEIEDGLSWERIDRFGLEYRYVARHLQGRIDGARMYQELNTRIHQFAKRQRTWFRRMERRGIQIHWIQGDDYPALRKLVLPCLEGRPAGSEG